MTFDLIKRWYMATRPTAPHFHPNYLWKVNFTWFPSSESHSDLLINLIKCLSHFEWFFKHHIWYRMFTQSVRTTQQHFQTRKEGMFCWTFHLLTFGLFFLSNSIEKGEADVDAAPASFRFLLTSDFLQTLSSVTPQEITHWFLQV